MLCHCFTIDRKERRKLATHVPERKQILTMDPREYERLQRKRYAIFVYCPTLVDLIFYPAWLGAHEPRLC